MGGFIYYGISGIPDQTLAPPPPAAAVAREANSPTDGTYIIPSPTTENMAELQAAGSRRLGAHPPPRRRQ